MNVMLLCLPLKDGFKDIERRAGVPAEVYEEGELEHPAIPRLMLSFDERLYGGYLEIWDNDTGEVRAETIKEKPFRIQWKKPIARSPSSTEKDFVLIDLEPFKKPEKKQTKSYSEVKYLKAKDAQAKAQRETDKKLAADIQEQQQRAAAKTRETRDKQDIQARLQSEADKLVNKYLQIISNHLAPQLELMKQTKSGEKKNNPRLEQLEQQLTNVVAQLEKMYSDIGSGSLIGDIGFSSEENFQEAVDDLVNEIAKLNGLIQTSKEVNVGIGR